MPELPEVETLRRMLESRAVGRTVTGVARSRSRLHTASKSSSLTPLVGRTLERVGRRGKYLLFGFGDRTLLSHLGMSGRWLFFERRPEAPMAHVHARLDFTDGTMLWFQDPRRFGQLRVVRTERIPQDPSIAVLGMDPLEQRPTGHTLHEMARRAAVNVKNFLLDQSRIAGIGNIYASEILFRSRIDPRRRSRTLGVVEWEAVAREVPAVLEEAIAGMGTTFSMYRTLWNEPGQYGERLCVYDRAGEPCLRCGTPVRRIVQGARATFYCPSCQGGRGHARGNRPRRKHAGAPPSRGRRRENDG
jgi:formamidopyrimidine-DNA glycosylase